MEKSVKFNKEKLKMVFFKEKMRTGEKYEEFNKRLALKINTYYSRFHKGRIGNTGFRRLLGIFGADNKELLNCFELSIEQRVFFGLPIDWDNK